MVRVSFLSISMLGGDAMYKAALIILAGLCAAICGCGGGGEEEQESSIQVNIQSTRFVPREVFIQPGGFVVFKNQDTVPHQVVSGTLTATPNPQTISPISIQQSNQFFPNTVEATLGDTLQFRNDTISEFNLQIVDDAGNVIASALIPPGNIFQFSSFPHAGVYTYRSNSGQAFSGTATIFGIPNPDNRFATPLLQPGQTARVQFPSTGTFNYFDLNQEQFNRSFMTGDVVVQ